MLGWMNDELEETWKENAVAIRCNIPAFASRDCGKESKSSGHSVSRPRFDPSSSKIREVNLFGS
jgi:hypothetical protein